MAAMSKSCIWMRHNLRHLDLLYPYLYDLAKEPSDMCLRSLISPVALLLLASFSIILRSSAVEVIIDNKAQSELMEAFNKWIVQRAYTITVKVGEKLKGMTAAWVAKVSLNRPMVIVSISPKNYTHELIKEAGYFAINIFGLWARGD